MMRRFAIPRTGIVDFSIFVALSGAFTLWLGREIAQTPELAGLDLLGWLLEPAVFSAMYFTLGRNWSSAGLLPRFKGNGGWFLLAATLPASLVGVLLVINQISGLVPLTPVGMQTGALVGLTSLGLFAAKNVVEEFAFRGFLTERFSQTVLAGLPGHILTGLIWAAWHLVYWFTLLPEGTIAQVSGLSTPVFVVLGFVALTLQSILLGELRLVTGSIWAGVVLHTMNNAFLTGLVAANAVPRGDFTAMVFTPVDFGLAYTGAMAVIGLFVWRWRNSDASRVIQVYGRSGV